MTAARLVSNPAEGHGLTQRITDPLFHALANDDDVESIPCVVLLKPVGHGSRNTANGRKQFVQFEVARLEPVHDEHDAENIRHMLQTAWDKRHGPVLPLDYDTRGPDEQRRFLLGLIEDDWAAEEGLTVTDIKERWQTFWGIASDDVPTDGSFPHPDYKKAAPHHLREFALTQGVIADEPVSGSALSNEVEDPGTVQVSDVDELETVDA